MKELVTLLAAVAAAAGVSVWISSGAATAPSAPPDAAAGADPAAAGPAPAAATDTSGWQRLERAIDRLTDRITALEQRVAAGGTGPERVAATPATATIDTAALRRALDEVEAARERERFAVFGDRELLGEVQTLLNGKDLSTAEAALRQLLARDLGVDERAQAAIQLGMLQRQRGDHEAAEATLRGVVDARGMHDKTGSWAGYQLAWTMRERDPAAARGVADRLAGEAADEGIRTRARWTAARMSEELGDFVRARADYTALLAEYGDSKQFADVAKDVRWRLEQLDGR